MNHDPHESHYADRASGFAPSPIREIFETSMQPGIISLAGGNPALEVLPLDKLATMTAQVVQERGLEALQYGSSEGTSELQELIVAVMNAECIPAATENVLVTAGSQMALQLVGTMFINPGDVVITEGPTYVGALSVFGGLQATVQHVLMDDDGINPAALRTALETAQASGQRIAFVYLIPNFHNPTGRTLSAARRPEIVALCREFNVLIVEDNPYGMLRYGGERAPSLYELDPENVLYLGSFSKIFAPGLRVGWVVAPTAVKARLLLAEEAAAICPSVLSQLVVESYIGSFDWRAQVTAFNELYAARRDALLAALEAHMPPGTTWTTPDGGFFTWVTLGPEITASSSDLMHRALAAKVAFIPGTAFYADGNGERELRLAFSFVDAAAATEAVTRLAQVIASA